MQKTNKYTSRYVDTVILEVVEETNCFGNTIYNYITEAGTFTSSFFNKAPLNVPVNVELRVEKTVRPRTFFLNAKVI